MSKSVKLLTAIATASVAASLFASAAQAAPLPDQSKEFEAVSKEFEAVSKEFEPVSKEFEPVSKEFEPVPMG